MSTGAPRPTPTRATPAVTFREARESDAAAVAAIHVASWRDAYRSILDRRFLGERIETEHLSLWRRRLMHPRPNLLVEAATDADRRPVGFASAVCDEDRYWGSLLESLHVLPELRGRGIGEALLHHMARRLTERATDVRLHLWVFESNEAALRFYRRMGGEVVGRDTSRLPAANGTAVLRVCWPSVSSLLGGQPAARFRPASCRRA